MYYQSGAVIADAVGVCSSPTTDFSTMKFLGVP